MDQIVDRRHKEVGGKPHIEVVGERISKSNANSNIDNHKKNWKGTFWKDYTAGTIGGVTGVLLSHPFDTIRVRIQTNKNYSGIFNCVRKSFREYGFFRGFYSGITPSLAGVGLEKCVCFGTYSVLKNSSFIPQTSNGLIATMFLTGCVAGVTASTVVTPVERIKINMQAVHTETGKRLHSNTISCFRAITKDSGLIGLYKGFSPTVVREALGYGLYFSTYEYLKRRYSGPHDNGSLSVWKTLLFGGLSGSSAWLLIYPTDVIKSRLQVNNKDQKYEGVIDCVRNTYRQEGLRVFYRGFSTSILRAFPLHAGVFCGYELSMKHLF